MIGPLVAGTFICDGLTFHVRLGSLSLRTRRPPLLSLILLNVFVLVPAWFYIHTVRLIDGPLQNARRSMSYLTNGSWHAHPPRARCSR